MSFMKRLANLISGNRGDENRFLTVYALSRRCREPVAIRVDLHNELSRVEEGDGYYVRKVVQTAGEKRCFDQLEVELWLDKNRRLTEHAVQGGRWLDEAEYAAEVEKFHAPEEEVED
ncbi:MAG: hypothetical protein KDD92_02225 [Caldilineaceae bacterium]|nr:hypothetical protein [Caldilineaceae bacterium]